MTISLMFFGHPRRKWQEKVCETEHYWSQQLRAHSNQHLETIFSRRSLIRQLHCSTL